MTTQQKALLDALVQAGWELAANEPLHEWWADEVWRMRSVWSPAGREFFLTFLVDPQLDLHRQRRSGEGVWAVSASGSLPSSREEAQEEFCFSLGHGWGERLDGFIEQVSRFRKSNHTSPKRP
jgi:hypothetical protein